MQVVLVFPPCDAEPLAHVPEEEPGRVVVGALLEQLVVEDVMGQPAALLPEERLRAEASVEAGRRKRRDVVP